MKRTTLLLAAALLAIGCTDDPDTPDGPAAGAERHALVLCEGSWGSNDASLARVATANGAIDPEWFEAANGRGLGDVGQDILLYGPKAYVAVTFSNTIEVVDTADGTSSQHSLGNLHPRFLAAEGGRLFVSCYEGRQVVVYDTADLAAPVAHLPLGEYQPEGVAIAGGRLFVASSWIQRANQQYDYDSTVYIFDLATLNPIGTVDVGMNPQMAVTIDDGHVAVNYNGDYGAHPAGCAIIDAGTLTVSQLNRSATGMASAGGVLYAYSRQGYGAASTSTFWSYDGTTTTTIPIDINTPYSISADAQSGDLYVTTDGNYSAAGDVVCLAPDGSQRWRCEAGMLPKKVVPLR